ncbi:MAG: hypothetical protein IPK60_06035 [Sandaracinaceae bacterium]|nr:hypothetical protein [Sandaracinaceae bacterium]
MIRPFLAMAVLLVLCGAAPFQCASDPDTTLETEDSAPEALWNLAERFRADGNVDARRVTLQELRDRYPSSRFAQRARQELEGSAPQVVAPSTASPAAR